MVTETKAAKVFKDVRLIVSYGLDLLRYGLGGGGNVGGPDDP
jgi:hypothetical protein